MTSERPTSDDSIAHFAQLLALLRPKQQNFLTAFRVFGDVSKASKQSKVARRSHYVWMANDTQYRKAFELCSSTVCYRIEDALIPRLASGWKEPVYQGGKLVGYVRKFDNIGCLRYLERRSPKFKPKSEIEANGIVPIHFYLPDNGRNETSSDGSITVYPEGEMTVRGK